MTRFVVSVSLLLLILCGPSLTAFGQDQQPDGGLAGDSDVEGDVGDAEADVGDAEADVGDAAGDERDGERDAAEIEVAPAGEGGTAEVAPLSTEVDVAYGLADDEVWIFIDKSERRMVVNDGAGWREAFRVALGQNPEGDKRWEGDGRTPEGEFYICRRIVHNRFHRFLGVSYPGPDDAEYGRSRRWLQPIEYRSIHRAFRLKRQPPWQTKLGGSIGIHGYGTRRDRARLHAKGEDWTDGCIAVTNEEIERIYDRVKLKTRVLIVP
jgi:lipoprotein-anchoring transpeptidase ErfK/SrfK